MTEERIDIQISDGGTTAQLQRLLQDLGVSAEQATARIATGFNRASTSQQGLVSNQILLSRGAKNASVDTQLLADALDKMTTAELNAAARGDALVSSINRAGSAAKSGGGAIDAHGKSVNNLSASYSRLGPVIQGALAFLSVAAITEASDAFVTIKNRIQSVTEAVQGGNVGADLGKRLTEIGGSFQETSSVIDISAQKIKQSTSVINASLGERSISVDRARQALAEFDAGTENAALAGREYVSIIKSSQSAEQERAGLVKQLTEAVNAQAAADKRGAESQRTLASTTQETKDVYASLLKSSIENGQELETLAKLYQRVGSASEDLGISSDRVVRFVQLFSDGLRTAGVSGVAASRSITELAEGFSQGTLKGQQLRSLLINFPQALQPLANAETGGSISKLKEKFDGAGFAITKVVDAYIKDSSRIEQAASQTTLTIAGSFTSVKNAFIDFIGNSREAGGAADFVSTGLKLLASNIGPAVIGLGILAGAFAAVRIVGLVGALAGIVTAITPIGALFIAAGAALSILANSFIASEEASGNARDGIGALRNAFQSVKPFIDIIKDSVGSFIDALKGLGSALFGSTNGGDLFLNVLRAIAAITSVIVVGILKIAEVGVQVFTSLVNGARQAADAISSIYNALRGAPAAPASSQGPSQSIIDRAQDAEQDSTDFRDGGMIYARNGINLNGGFRVPGVDRPDTVPLPLMVSKGERVIVQTEDQQAKHDAMVRAFKNFRDGGMIYARDGAVANGGTSVGRGGGGSAKGFYTDDDLVGTTDAERDAARAANNRLFNRRLRQNPDSPFSLGPNVRGQSIFVDGAAAPGSTTGYNGFGVQDVPEASDRVAKTAIPSIRTAAEDPESPLNRGKAGVLNYDPWASQWATIGDGAPADTYVGIARQNGLTIAPGISSANGDTDPGRWNDPGLPYVDGSSPAIKQYDGSGFTIDALRSPFGFPMTNGIPILLVGGFSGVGGYSFGDKLSSGDQSKWWGININDYAILTSGGGYGTFVGGNGQNGAPTDLDNRTRDGLGLRDGGTIYARDGLDFDVPGAGAVDSRTMKLALSPGENVKVSTADQAAKDRGAPQTIVHNNTVKVVTPDADSFRRSSRQIANAQKKAIGRATLTRA